MGKNKSWKKNLIKVVGLAVGLLILWFMIKEIIENWAAIQPYLSNMKIPLFALSVLVYGAAFLFTGYNWTYLLWKMEAGPGRREYLNAHMVSALARYIPGGKHAESSGVSLPKYEASVPRDILPRSSPQLSPLSEAA